MKQTNKPVRKRENYIRIEPIALAGYTVIPHQIIEAPLSPWAKAVWMYLYSRPPGWQIFRDDILKRFRAGSMSTKRLLAASKELQLEGYLRITPIKASNGKYDGWRWQVAALADAEWQVAAARKFKVKTIQVQAPLGTGRIAVPLKIIERKLERSER